MRQITALLACACAALALTGAASSTTFGVADDAGKYADDGGAGFFHMLTDLGMTENRMAVFWDPSRPDTIVDQAFLDRAMPQAMQRGIQIIFAIYPIKARSLVDTPNGVQLFAQYAARVVKRYPYVRKVICLNEGNQPRFHQPQFDETGKGISGYVQEQAMAACYDAVKAVDPNITVIAFGISPRGNDDFDAPSNVSHSPIRFLEEVGEAYRASGRTKPIADEVSIHCYPNQNTDAPALGYAWPKVGCANLNRFKQAWWDAFHGTAQPLFREAGDKGSGPYVHIYVDEVGYQAKVPANKLGLYSGSENVALIDEPTQGKYYGELIAMMACDPNVALLNFFHAVDEPTGLAERTRPTRRHAATVFLRRQGCLDCQSGVSRHDRGVDAHEPRRRWEGDVQDAAAHVRRQGGRRVHLRREDHADDEHADAHRRVRTCRRGARPPLQAPEAPAGLIPGDRHPPRRDEPGADNRLHPEL
jgi:hypothetical protein